MIDHRSSILVTGSRGFVGTAVTKVLRKHGYRNLSTPSSKEFDIRSIAACKKYLKNIEYIIHMGANVGGIGYNQKFPADIYHDNLQMGLNLLKVSQKYGIKKLVMMGTVCAYPKFTPVPFSEDDLWNGYPEETNAPYGLAKRVLLTGAHAFRTQYGLSSIMIFPTNIYGPGDNFEDVRSHVIPALIKKIVIAKRTHQPVMVWGTGTARREFIYIDDVASAVVDAFEKYDDSKPLNLGSGEEISIAQLVSKIAALVKFRGPINWDTKKPDGQPRRLLDSTRAKQAFGFNPQVSIDQGLQKTINWYIRTYP